MSDLDKIREQFLSNDVDEETYVENKKLLDEWEQGILHNTALAAWQDHDITRELSLKARDAYKEASMTLATNRTLTEAQRYSLWGKQDAALLILSLTETNAKDVLEQINNEIKRALYS